MEAKIKKRALNFTEEEEQLLVAIVEKYKNVLECKIPGAVTWKEKDVIWAKVVNEFNSSNTRNLFRNRKHLKEKLNNLKKQTRRKLTVKRTKDLLQTDGGTINPEVMSKVDETIHGRYDGDELAVELNESVELDRVANKVELTNDDKCIEENFEALEEQEFEVADNGEMDWTTHSSNNLKQTPSKKILTRTGKKYTDKNSQLINEKRSFLKYQRECFEKEHDDKRSFLKYQRECFEKEHKLQMELLIKKNKIADQKLLLNIIKIE